MQTATIKQFESKTLGVVEPLPTALPCSGPAPNQTSIRGHSKRHKNLCRDLILEPLTQEERALLSTLRQQSLESLRTELRLENASKPDMRKRTYETRHCNQRLDKDGHYYREPFRVQPSSEQTLCPAHRRKAELPGMLSLAG